VTEDNYFLTFKMFRKGPAEKDYLISLIDSEPPLSPKPVYEKEVYVKDDIIIQGREFTLDSPFPSLSKTAFTAMRIFSNVEEVVIPSINT
jgi:hypothetical protein